MLILEIAAGIILAALVLRFWRQSVALALLAVVVVLLIVGIAWASSLTWSDLGSFALTVGTIAVFYLLIFGIVFTYRRALAYWKRH